ncbi:DUF2817 domain-containing protein [Amphritea sp. 1_MG-2023]|uniref:M14 family zinc carboxypeptidase n=1 Tax=Amphritea sp. 1_MG-2023 TaxID=3062670 RepID=UPI0026E342F7|nr:M14 family zinc carboxypeptidase [Amphritea sp. 1_MG-2023]MDO6562798.1 DUF2817 domain-containing protein [Amphritea sp. 1_MG-2023]
MLQPVVFFSILGLSLCASLPAISEPEDPLKYYISSPEMTDTQHPEPQAADAAPIEAANASQVDTESSETPITPNVNSKASSAPQLAGDSVIQPTPASQATQQDARDVGNEASVDDKHVSGNTLERAEENAETQLAAPIATVIEAVAPNPEIVAICHEIGNKLGSISSDDCLEANFDAPRFYSNKHRPLLEKHFHANATLESAPRILFLGGIHGDEYSSVSLSFKWLKKLHQQHSGIYDWHFMPLTNPDGLLQKRSTRVNANNVDLNRNFIPSETAIDPVKHWQTYARKRARYYPGTTPLSEPETRAIHKLINELSPDIIVSVHAPHGILDYDGSITPPRKLGPLHLKQLGTYPGSLGNYGWFVKQIPVMTIELKHAGIMPTNQEMDHMWNDLIIWINLRTEGDGSLLARKEDDAKKPSL